MTDMLTRSFQLRATASDDQAHTVSGLAVPYDTEIELFDGYYETVAAGAVRAATEGSTAMKLLWRHDEPIGLITHTEDTTDGLMITATISATPRGDEAYQLLKDGVIDRFSIGFIPIQYEETRDQDGTHITHTEIEVREVSLVPWPAYDGAIVTQVRSTPTTTKENTPMTDSTATYATVDDLTQIRASVDDLTQGIALMRADLDATPAATLDTRSAGEVLKAIAAGDDATITQVNDLTRRAWNGTTTAADSTMDTPAWIGDLTRLFNAPDPLKAQFSTGSLPAEGMSLEYTQLFTNTITVDEQKNQGDDLKMGTLTTKDATATVKTFGGYTSLSRQAIERSRVNLLNHHLTGMTLAAAKASADNFAAEYAASVKTQASSALSISKAITALTWADLSDIIIDAAAAYTDQALTLDGLIVDKDTFKGLARLTDADGRPLMSVAGTGVNTTGTMNLTGLTGNLVGLTIIPNLRQKKDALGTGVVGSFFNSQAMRTYETSLVQLQDENIINLTRAFSIYRYAAITTEIPTALIPLKIGA